MRIQLVHLPAGATSADSALGLPLGRRAQVAARIVELLPGATFDGGRGTFRRASYELIFTIDGDEPAVIDVEIDRPDGITALKRIVDKTGWRVIDPDGPSFVDLEASRAAGALVAVGSYEERPPAASSTSNAESRAKTRTLIIARWAVASVAVWAVTPVRPPAEWMVPIAAVAGPALAQWLVLRPYVSWAGDWSTATAIRAVLQPSLFVAFSTWVIERGVLWMIGAQIASLVVSAVPQALVLWRLGYRGSIWLATRPVWYLLLIAGIAALPSTIQLGLLALAGGLVDALALVWSVDWAREPRQHAKAVPGSGREADARAAGGTFVASVIWCLTASLAVLVLFALPLVYEPVAIMRLRPATEYEPFSFLNAIAISAATMVPVYVLALVLTTAARTRQFGLALAAGSAVMTLLLMLPFSSPERAVVFGGARWPVLLLLAVLGGVQIALLAAARRALAAVPIPARRVAAIPFGLLVPAVCLAAVFYAASAPERARRVMMDHTVAVKRTFNAIRDCVEGYASSYPDRGFPVRLELLGPTGDQCVSAAVAAGQDLGYRFMYAAGVPDVAGRVQLYSLCARPTRFPDAGKETLVADQRYPAMSQAGDERRQTTSYRCVEMNIDAVAVIEHCAATYAAEHPGAGYPPTLADISECVTTTEHPDVRTHSVASSSLRYTYIAAPPDERGVIGRFEIYGVTRPSFGVKQSFADETGVVRIARAKRLAAPHDPTERDDFEAEKARTERGRLPLVDLARKCDAGDQMSCVDFATKMPRTDPADVEHIVRLYTTACESGIAAACSRLGQFFVESSVVPFDLDRTARWFERACALGDGDACHRLAVLFRGTRPRLAVGLDERGCRLKHGESCFELKLFEDSCRFGFAQGCYQLAVLNGHDRRLLLKACAGGDFPECADLNPISNRQRSPRP